MLRPQMAVPLSRSALLILLAVAIGIAGCGGDDGRGSDKAAQQATLLLDFAPNAVHAGTYLAAARGCDRDQGLKLNVRAPASGADAIKLLRSGRADLAYMDIHDLAIADAKAPGELVGVMAVVQRPLAALLAIPEIDRPRDLEGRRTGVSGLPSDIAVMRSIVAGDGGDPDKVKPVTIGFQAVAALLARRTASATGFWNVEGLALREKQPNAKEFRVDDYGAPAYPELVMVARRDALQRDPEIARRAILALRCGYEAALEDPPAAIDALTKGARGVDADSARREFIAVSPAFMPPGGRYGDLRHRELSQWASWEKRFGIVDRRPALSRLFVFDLAGSRG
jgi:ABC-type nitrate/sulfonate/bicarbonate transport system substrate-binding protein